MTDIVEQTTIIEMTYETPQSVVITPTNSVIEMIYTSPGPKGEQGPKGDPGPASPVYIHYQDLPANQWTVMHNLNKFPSVSIVDSGGSNVFGDIVYINDTTLTITFSTVFSGKAYCN